MSELFPHIAACADDLCLIRSMRNDHADHFQATLGIDFQDPITVLRGEVLQETARFDYLFGQSSDGTVDTPQGIGAFVE